MKCDLDLIIQILHKVESHGTTKEIVFAHGVFYNGQHYKIDDEEQFLRIYKNTLFIHDHDLANVRIIEKRRAIGIDRITPKGENFLYKGLILKAINHDKAKSSERELTQVLELNQHIVHHYLEQLNDEGFILAPKAFVEGEHEYQNCVLKSKGKEALENPSCLLQKSNINMPTNNQYNFNAPVGSVNNQGTQASVAGINQGNQIGTQYNCEIKQTLAEAAAEIQNLLKQLEQSNPNATVEQQQAYVDAAIPPTLKERLVSALKAGGETAIEEFFDNSYINVGKALIKGWIKPD